MLQRSVVEKFYREVLQRSDAEWQRSVAEVCCGDLLQRSVAEKCGGDVLWRGVVKKCCRELL